MPRRTIYSADQASPSTYDTTFADFLDSLPQYVNQFQENQIKLGRQQLEDKRYEDKKALDATKYADAKTQQGIVNTRNQQNDALKFHETVMNDFSDSQKTLYIENVLKKDEKLKGIADFSNFDNFTTSVNNTTNAYRDVDSLVDDIRGISIIGQFERYGEIADTYDKLRAMEESVRGTDLEGAHAEDLKFMSDTKRMIEGNAGKEMAEKDMPATDRKLFKQLNDSFSIAQKSFMEAELGMAEIGKREDVMTKSGRKVNKWMPIPLTMTYVTPTEERAFLAKDRAYGVAKRKRDDLGEQLEKFTTQKKLFYPEIQTTSEIKKESDRLERETDERQEWFDKNEKYINTNPDLAGTMLEYLESDDDAGKFNALQEQTNNFLAFEEDIRVLEEEAMSNVPVERPPATDVVEGRTGIGRFSYEGKEAIISFDDTKTTPTGETAYLIEQDGDQFFMTEDSLPKNIKMEKSAPDAPDAPVTEVPTPDVDEDIEEIDQELAKIQQEYEDESKLNEYLSQLAQKKGLTVQAKPIGPGNVSLAPGMVGDQPLEQLDFGQPKLFPEKPVPSSPERIKSLEIKDTKGSNLDIDNLPKLNKQLTSMVKEVERIEKRYLQEDSPDKKSQAKIENDLRKLSISIDALPDNIKNKNLKMTVNQIIKKLNASKKKIRKVKQAKRRTR